MRAVSAILVRRAVAADVPAIADVHVRAWRAAYRGLVADDVLDRLTVDGRARMWEELLAMEGEAPGTTVAEVDGAIAGFCTVVTPSRDDDAPAGTAEITRSTSTPRCSGAASARPCWRTRWAASDSGAWAASDSGAGSASRSG